MSPSRIAISDNLDVGHDDEVPNSLLGYMQASARHHILLLCCEYSHDSGCPADEDAAQVVQFLDGHLTTAARFQEVL